MVRCQTIRLFWVSVINVLYGLLRGILQGYYEGDASVRNVVLY